MKWHYIFIFFLSWINLTQKENLLTIQKWLKQYYKNLFKVNKEHKNYVVSVINCNKVIVPVKVFTTG